MRRRPARKLQTQTTDPVSAALARARRARRKGHDRHEFHALREACALGEYDATLWTMLGAACLRQERWEEAVSALKHALWLRERAGEEKRAVVTRKLLGLAGRESPMHRVAA